MNETTSPSKFSIHIEGWRTGVSEAIGLNSLLSEHPYPAEDKLITLENLLEEVERLPPTDKRRLVRHLLDELQEEKRTASQQEDWPSFVSRMYGTLADDLISSNDRPNCRLPSATPSTNTLLGDLRVFAFRPSLCVSGSPHLRVMLVLTEK